MQFGRRLMVNYSNAPQAVVTYGATLLLINRLSESRQFLAEVPSHLTSIPAVRRLIERVSAVVGAKEEADAAFHSEKWSDAVLKYTKVLERQVRGRLFMEIRC